MTDPTKKPRPLRILGEETVRRDAAAADGADDVENPYWLLEEPDPHPDPSLGCVRRGICCRSSPGWFAPGEVELAAELLGLEPDVFVRRYVVIDALELDGAPVEVFAPVKLGRDGRPAIPPATRADALYRTLRGTCIFFTGEGCRIYAARPAECAAYVCVNAPEDNLSHEALARRWRGDAGA